METNFYFIVFRETYGSISIQVKGGHISYVCNGEIFDEPYDDLMVNYAENNKRKIVAKLLAQKNKK